MLSSFWATSVSQVKVQIRRRVLSRILQMLPWTDREISTLQILSTAESRFWIQRGNILRSFGTRGDRPGQFIRPKGIAVDSEGHVYVADAEFNNFQVLSPEGQPLLAVGKLGDSPRRIRTYCGITHRFKGSDLHNRDVRGADAGLSVHRTT